MYLNSNFTNRLMHNAFCENWKLSRYNSSMFIGKSSRAWSWPLPWYLLLCQESIGHQWMPNEKDINADRWVCLRCTSEWTFQQTMERSVKRGLALIIVMYEMKLKYNT